MAAGPTQLPGCRRATACTTTSTPPGSTACSGRRRCGSGSATTPPARSSGCVGEVRMTRIAVVIVTYNSAEVLIDCLASLRTAEGVDLATVVVADNNSRDKSLRIAQDTEG